MLHIALAILLLFFLLAIRFTQKIHLDPIQSTSPKNDFQEKKRCSFPQASTLVATIILIFYGFIGHVIYLTSTSPIKSLIFWPSYIIAGLLYCDLLPTWLSLKLSPKILQSLRSLLTFPHSLSASFHKKSQYSKQSSDCLWTTYAFQNQLSEAISSFDKLIVREVMIPKIDIFALPEEISIQEALPKIIEEGYSRIPIYQKNLDNITGVLLVKDILKLSKNSDDFLQPVSSVAKPPLYAPEIKKAASLLQEFRQKHRHLAIVVNEYGFTEGIATMEDIIEEIFGEIADEYDVQEDLPYKKIGNSWIVDGRMNISDAEEYFNLKIEHGNSYDTLGGHVFHKAGAVPQKGMKIHHENFDIEIITCSERSVGKLKITPRKRKSNDS
ncbi:hemolysin family protein [Chlamydia sp. 17-3921]|uniref:hemolysin family protein n=1 Tax=Chlamydia sp. 17-3921 TaxID=2675798 RepID=UPI001917A9D1|nr:hemolysin family protein [Chlamydia sp. 17-3921]